MEHNKRDIKVIIISPKQNVIFKKQNSPTLCLMFIMPHTHCRITFSISELFVLASWEGPERHAVELLRAGQDHQGDPSQHKNVSKAFWLNRELLGEDSTWDRSSFWGQHKVLSHFCSITFGSVYSRECLHKLVTNLQVLLKYVGLTGKAPVLPLSLAQGIRPVSESRALPGLCCTTHFLQCAFSSFVRTVSLEGHLGTCHAFWGCFHSKPRFWLLLSSAPQNQRTALPWQAQASWVPSPDQGCGILVVCEGKFGWKHCGHFEKITENLWKKENELEKL